ncbi:MAG: 8-amino-7-oxononanoate synthase [Gammaproteobacteria bacterium]|nr:8-amino-7-oxononanoate synthase [Gammaproteobacteria bacterium]
MADYASLEAGLAERKAQHLYRHRQVIESPQGAELSINGQTYLNFCSNDYLGLANHPKIVETFTSAAKEYGVGSGAAHLVSGHSYHHHQLEEELAEFTGYPRALVFSTGYMANLGVISALLGQGDAVFEDRLNHASLLDAGLLSQARLQRYQHLDGDDLDHKISSSRAKQKLIASDGVFSMDGDIADVKQLAQIASGYDSWLMIDDAHGLAVMGQTGRGTLEHFGLGVADVPILMGTFGKALGTFGAFVAGEEVLIETLIQKARSYIYTTALPPALAAASREALRVVQTESDHREQLHTRIKQFREGVSQLGLPVMESVSAIQPLMIGESDQALAISETLRQQGLLITAIRPPTVPADTARLRITLSAAHTETHIDQLLDTLARVIKV